MILDYKALLIVDGMSEQDIFDLFDKETAPLILDLRTGPIEKTVNDLVREYNAYKKKQLASRGLRAPELPDDKHRPPEITIGNE
jgi:hypothetical protein